MDLYMLTTTDNPFDPRTHYDAWLTWDMQYYNSMGLLARVVRTSDDLPESDQLQAIQDGIEEIVRENLSGVHRRLRVSAEAVGSEESSDNGDSTANRAA